MASMLLLAAVIVVVSGLIAYIGDLVGRKMGRKRLTLFGMRPRHTAIVISVVVGMLIAASTLAATFAVSKPVRDAFLTPRYKLIAELRQQEAAVRETHVQLDEARRQARAMQNDLQRQKAALAQTTGKLDRSVTKARLTQQQLSSAEQSLSQIQSELATSQRALSRVNADLATAQVKLQETGKLYLKKREELEGVRQLLTDTQRMLTDTQTSLGALATAKLAFVPGQEILTGVIPTTGSEAQRKELLGKFLHTANQAVHQRCTRLPLGDPALVYLVMEKKPVPVQISLNEAVEVLSTRIAGVTGHREVVVQLTPFNNVPLEGQAGILVDQIPLIPNAVAFQKGARIAVADLTITSETTNADIVSTLVGELLQTRLPAALREKGVMMVTRRFDPATSTVPEASVPIVQWSDILTAAEKAHNLGGNVQIIVRARATISTFGPVDLVLEVVPAP
jgi:uncharacterized protein (DUF3084 family)